MRRYTTKRNGLRTHIVKATAAKTGKSINYVYRVIEGSRNNQAVFDTYMILKERAETAIARAAAELVPFDN